MPSNDEKKPEQDAGNSLTFKAKKATGTTTVAKPKKHLSIGWWFGIIVLILISISFVLAPAIEAVVGRKQNNGLVFGTYGKEEIKYAYGNYFYDQYQNYANQYKSSSDTNQIQTLYQIWKSAYDSTVMYTAVTQMAKQAGIIASDAVVNRKIISGGYYDVDGKFDSATYNKATTEQKASIETSVRRSVPFQIVANDVGSVLSSQGEQEYVAAMADNSRSFEYVTFDSSSYPDDLASQYALANKQLFYSMGLSVISTTTKEEAEAIVSTISKGEKSFEDAAVASSKDSFANAKGKIGTVYYYAIASNFKNADEAQLLLTSATGQVLGPFEGQNGWSIYRLDSAPTEPDFTNSTLLSGVKAYMSSYDSAVINDYLSAQATKFAADAKSTDFGTAADKAGLTVNDVAATPMNIGNSTYLGSFSYTDAKGLLASAANDSTNATKLYIAEPESITDPMKAGTSYVVAKIGKTDSASSGLGSYLKTFYSYLSANNNQQDMAQAILASDQLKDNFMNTFLSQILGNTTSK
ncbi:MAG: SurA N-terminal domain-containing protein [Sphaerochaetaceae bacterium]